MPINDIQEALLISRPFLGAVAFWLGATIGSFINVVSLRLPKMMEKDWRSQCHELLGLSAKDEQAPQVFNLAFPASHCPHCNYSIRWWENIPVISYLFLRGKCSNCSHPISMRYPIVEIISAVLSTVVVLHLGFGATAMAALLFTWVLITLTVIDYDTHLLPDDITLSLLWVGLILNIFNIFVPLQDAVIGAMAGYMTLWSVYWIFRLLTGKEGMGFGDFKLLAALGAWLGWQALPVIILLASFTGSIIGLGMILAKNKDLRAPVPFGPYLAAAGWISLLWGDGILNTLNYYLYTH